MNEEIRKGFIDIAKSSYDQGINDCLDTVNHGFTSLKAIGVTILSIDDIIKIIASTKETMANLSKKQVNEQ